MGTRLKLFLKQPITIHAILWFFGVQWIVVIPYILMEPAPASDLNSIVAHYVPRLRAFLAGPLVFWPLNLLSIQFFFWVVPWALGSLALYLAIYFKLIPKTAGLWAIWLSWFVDVSLKSYYFRFNDALSFGLTMLLSPVWIAVTMMSVLVIGRAIKDYKDS